LTVGPYCNKGLFMRLKSALVLMLGFACLAAPALAQNRAAKPLTIYVVDVEGSNGVLFVSPTGESLLMDTGNANAAAPRDAGRILEAGRDDRLHQLDHRM